MNTKTYINNKCVGNGKWKFQSIKNYCLKKGIELETAFYQTYSMRYGFDYEFLDIKTGLVRNTMNSDPMSLMLGI